MSIVALKKQRDFDRVFREGKFAIKANLIVYALPNSLGFTRVGISIGAKVGGAVLRNRLRRWVREILRKEMNNIVPGFDVVVVIKSVEPFVFEEFRKTFLFLLRNRGIVKLGGREAYS